MTDILPLGRYLACRGCGTLVPAGLPGHGELDPAAQELALGVQEFLFEHGSHDICELRRTAAESVSEGPLWDPMAVVYVELTDGEQRYVARAQRSGVDEPRRYVFAPHSLRVGPPQVDIDEADLRRGLDLEFFPHAVRPTKIEAFVGAVQAALRGIDVRDLEIAYVDAQDPGVSIARLPERAWQELLAASARIFDPRELAHVQRFLEGNRGEDGALVLRIRRQTMVCNE